MPLESSNVLHTFCQAVLNLHVLDKSPFQLKDAMLLRLLHFSVSCMHSIAFCGASGVEVLSASCHQQRAASILVPSSHELIETLSASYNLILEHLCIINAFNRKLSCCMLGFGMVMQAMEVTAMRP
eukprot:834888-Amphidinium_carterae.1